MMQEIVYEIAQRQTILNKDSIFMRFKMDKFHNGR